MDNRPLLYVLDATARQFVPDMTFEEAEIIAVRNERLLRQVDVVADGMYRGYHLTCESYAGRYECYYTLPSGMPVGYAHGVTPAQAIERAQAQCT